MKPFLLIAGYTYYPDIGTGDWIACFETEEQAQKVGTELKYYSNSKNKKDWFVVVDLRDWMNSDSPNPE